MTKRPGATSDNGFISKKIHFYPLRVPFRQFFRNRLIGWIGHALLVQPSKTAHRIFFLYFYFSIFINFLKYETIVRSSAWSFGHSDPSSVLQDNNTLQVASKQSRNCTMHLIGSSFQLHSFLNTKILIPK